MNNRIKFYRV